MNTNPNSDNRSTNEVVVRVVATHIFALLNYGHFGSLLNLPGSLHAGYVVIFLFYPTVIIAQIVFGITEAIKYCIIAIGDDQDGLSADLSFYVQGALGYEHWSMVTTPLVMNKMIRHPYRSSE
jgi:hypothetical protein